MPIASRVEDGERERRGGHEQIDHAVAKSPPCDGPQASWARTHYTTCSLLPRGGVLSQAILWNNLAAQARGKFQRGDYTFLPRPPTTNDGQKHPPYVACVPVHSTSDRLPSGVLLSPTRTSGGTIAHAVLEPDLLRLRRT